MTSHRKLFERVAASWRRQGLALSPPATDAEVIDLFADLKYPLSRDVFQFYTTVGVAGESVMDEGLCACWSPSQIREQHDGPYQGLILFADYLLGSHYYGFRYENSEVSSVHWYTGGNHLGPVAASVAEFFDKRLREPFDDWALPV